MSPPVGAARAGVVGAQVAVIPDSVISRYDPTEESTGVLSTVTDREADRDLSGDTEVISSGIGGLQTYRMDGNDEPPQTSDDYVTTDVDFAIIFVYEIQEAVNSNKVIFDGGSDREFQLQDDNGGQFQIHRGGTDNENLGYSPDGNAHLGVLEGFTGGDVELRIDGVGQGVVTTNDDDLTGLIWADRRGFNNRLAVDFGDYEILADYAASDITDEESRLQSKWSTPALP